MCFKIKIKLEHCRSWMRRRRRRRRRWRLVVPGTIGPKRGCTCITTL